MAASVATFVATGMEFDPENTREPQDWGEGYYPDGLMQKDVIRRLLMCGHGTGERGYIPHGQVYGYSSYRLQTDNRKCNVGLDNKKTRTPKFP